ncbi:unnamed protein product [Adineta steineri]|uniref:TRAF1-6 MATH domain-containing protein n=1 Tax=Adineta steineri TaxID=433720 RepID=A0A818M5P1_9BILA|nr:unnamed protein product [Adineta steineri]
MFIFSEPFVCPFCQTKLSQKQEHADRGAERELNRVITVCYSCSWTGSYKDYLDHLQEYHADIECGNCHEHFFSLNSMEEHAEEICEYRCLQCKLPSCNELVKWRELAIHNLSNQHQIALLQFIVQYSRQGDQRSHNIDEELRNILQNIANLSPTTEKVTSDCTQLRAEYNEAKVTGERIISQINETAKRTNECAEKIIQYEQSQNTTFKDLNDVINASKFITTKLLDINSTVIFPFHLDQTDINSLFSMYSTLFKTTQVGYSFILRVCSTTDSTNQNQQYLSVFISLVRGEFDQLLVFPFPYTIFLYLCDQSGQGKHIISVIKPDLNESAFSRPLSEKNDEIDVMNFCPLSCINEAGSIYLKDNVFLIRVFIDFLNTGPTPFQFETVT